MSQSQEVILVTGATGNIGTALVHLLASDAGQPVVRAATRDVDAPAAALLRAMNPATVQPTVFDAARPETLAAAFAGVTKLCVVAPFGGEMDAWHAAVVGAARSAGTLEYAVKVSVTGARSPDSDPPPGRIPSLHWRGEEVIRQAGIPATMIRPTIYMQHFLTVPGLYTRGDDRFYLPTGAAATAFLDCRDIAAFAAKLLCASPEARQPYDDQAFELTGPAAVTAEEIAAILSAVAGRPVTPVDGEAAFVARCAALGVPDMPRYIYAEAAGGWFGGVENEAFTRLTGRRTTSFAKFAYDHASYFRPR